MKYIVKRIEDSEFSKINIEDFVEETKKILFPSYFEIADNELMEKLLFRVKNICSIYLKEKDAIVLDQILSNFRHKLKDVVITISKDLEAFIQGDPAANSYDEIILCYPGFFAIWVYRIAHIFEELEIPVFPRMLSEYAHSKTGIDIHPKTKIGEAFFIDHGTGIVIGETTIIGSHVKIYQGVTLGAISLGSGRLLKGIKRHPTIGDYVTIYANATILGGDVTIGNNCIIGSNVIITKSIEPKSVVKNSNSELEITKR